MCLKGVVLTPNLWPAICVVTVCHAGGAEDPAEGVAQTVAKPKPGPGPPHREIAAEPSAAAGPSAHRRNALPGKLHPKTSPGAGRHLEGARDVNKKQKITIAGEFCVTRHVIIHVLGYKIKLTWLVLISDPAACSHKG